MSLYQKTVPTSDVFTAAMLPADYPQLSTEPPCAQVDDIDGVFFPALGDEAVAAVEARKVCRDCGAQQACATYALRHGEVGTWGGLTERDRNAIRRRAS